MPTLLSLVPWGRQEVGSERRHLLRGKSFLFTHASSQWTNAHPAGGGFQSAVGLTETLWYNETHMKDNAHIMRSEPLTNAASVSVKCSRLQLSFCWYPRDNSSSLFPWAGTLKPKEWGLGHMLRQPRDALRTRSFHTLAKSQPSFHVEGRDSVCPYGYHRWQGVQPHTAD